MSEKIGGVPVEVLKDIARSTGGSFNDTFLFLPYTNRRGGGGQTRAIIAITRLGVTDTPDTFGTVTAKNRPGSLREALEGLDTISQSLKGKQ